jgi:hypothetical protein
MVETLLPDLILKHGPRVWSQSISTMSGNALAYFREQFHQPEDRSAIPVRLILL